jgi:hypothetical protein
MSAPAKPLNPYLVSLVILAVLGFTLAAVFAVTATRLLGDPLSAALFGNLAGWALALGTVATLAVLTVAAVRWQPKDAAPPDPGWSVSYPDPDR